MRHRVSFISPDNAVKTLNSTYVELASAPIVREDRLTFDVPALSHIATLVIHLNKGHSPAQFSPFGYHYQAGLHIYVVPQGMAEPHERENFFRQVNDQLLQLLGVSVPPDDWVLSLNSFYYHTLAVLEPKTELSLPHSWSAFDYYYSEGKAVVKQYAAELDLPVVDVAATDDYTEVGVFSLDEHTTKDDVVLSGLRAIFNDKEDDGADGADEDEVSGFVHRTMFHVKPRHRVVEPVEVTFRESGLHPVVEIGLAPEQPTEDDVALCSTFVYLTLEKSVFLDPYQLPDAVSVVASYGTKDLELPEYSTPGWGNEFLLEVGAAAQYPLLITLHSRYLLPGNRSRTVTVDKPVVFLGCDATVDAFLLGNSPFDNKRAVGGTFEKFFTDDTIFYHALGRGTGDVQIPTARGSPGFANVVTLLCLLVGVGMVLTKAWQRTAKQKRE